MTLAEIKARYPNASESFIRANADDYNRDFAATGNGRVCATDPKRTECLPLVSKTPRKAKGGSRPVQRYQVIYRIFAVRPADWDNNSIKGLQDLLVTAGLLPGDAWYQLCGSIISEKVHSKEEEKTIVEIIPCH